MYIQEWAAVIKQEGGQAVFKLTMQGLCPVCKEVRTFQGRSLEITEGVVRKAWILDWAINILIAKRQCECCGVDSAVPTLQAEQFKAVVIEALTPAWFEKTLGLLGCTTEERSGRAPEPDGSEYPYTGYRLIDSHAGYCEEHSFY